MQYYYRKWPLIVGAVICAAGIVLVAIRPQNSPLHEPVKPPVSSVENFGMQNGSLSARSTLPLVSSSGAALSQNDVIMMHTNIITTVFWVGETSDASNGYIPNAQSAWDGQWQAHYGGVDDDSHRNGFYPAAFTPKENPFYFALPYNDLTEKGNRKSSAGNCPNSSVASLANYSWCKNSWLAIKHGSKIVYAQWQDVGPFEEDDTAYVFGKAAPKNKQGEKAGLDVSPATRDYLGLEDISTCDWAFVSFNQVPDGPWKQIITTSPGEHL